MKALNNWRQARAFSTAVRAEFYQEIADALDKNITLYRAIKIKLEYYRRTRHPLAAVMKQLVQQLKEGRQLGDALRQLRLISPLEASLLSTSENAGKLKEGLMSVSDLVTGANKMKAEIAGALFYPVFLLALLVAIYVIHVFFIFPPFAEVLPLDQWTGLAAVYRDICLYIVNYGVMTVVLAGGLLFLGLKTLHDKPGPLREKLDNYPPFIFYRIYQASGFLMAVEIMLQARLMTADAIKSIQQHASPWLKSKITPIRRKIEDGREPGRCMVESSLFPDKPDTIKAKLDMYGQIGDFDKAVRVLSKTILALSIKVTRDLGVHLKNIMYVVIGGGMLLSYLGIGSIGTLIYESFKNLNT